MKFSIDGNSAASGGFIELSVEHPYSNGELKITCTTTRYGEAETVAIVLPADMFAELAEPMLAWLRARGGP